MARKKSPPVPLPDDVIMALEQQPEAREIFQQLPPSHQREYLEYILEAKKPETRQRRVQKTIEMLLKSRQ